MVEVKPSSSAKSEPTATELKDEGADKSETSQTIAKAENSHVLAPVDDGKNEPPRARVRMAVFKACSIVGRKSLRR